MQPQHVVPVEAGERGGLQGVVLLERLGKRGDQPSFGRDVAGSADRLGDPDHHRDLFRVELQGGELLIGLIHDPLQISVFVAQDFGFLLQRIVVGDFEGHAGVAGDETEQGKAA